MAGDLFILGGHHFLLYKCLHVTPCSIMQDLIIILAPAIIVTLQILPSNINSLAIRYKKHFCEC